MGKPACHNPNARLHVKELFQRLCSLVRHTPPPAKRPSRTSIPPPADPGGTILLIEVGQWNCASLLRLLEQAGYATQVASEQEAALQLAAHTSPALLIVGGKPDPGFYRALRCASPAPILVLAPKEDEEQALAAYEAGIDCYQAGYIGSREIVARVHALLRRGT